MQVSETPVLEEGTPQAPCNLPPTRLAKGSSGSRASSRAASPVPGSRAEEDEGCVQLQSRMEEHRCDPALRVALERLDAVRKKQPNVEDFTLDKYLSPDGSKPSVAESLTEAMLEGRSEDSSRVTTPLGGLRNFSTDLLLAAVRNGPGQGPSTWMAGSRSTSPGSTQQSSASGSVSNVSTSSARHPSGTPTGADGLPGGRPAAGRGQGMRPRLPQGQLSRAYENSREPAPPPGAPPRRPGRQRSGVLSARARRVEAAEEAAAANLGMYTAR
mmetsp:Transcript_105390/g.187406  ORF Transcript_105390/g.187406 Transcript_105390/m.187406 type:complete len:271 (-) Transcript_105390:186-998(-)